MIVKGDKVRMTQLEGRPKLRTHTVEGVCESPPELSRQFVLYGKGLEFGARRVNTSPIREVDYSRGSNDVRVTTESGSVYRIERLGA